MAAVMFRNREEASSSDDDDDLYPCVRHLEQEGNCEGFVCKKEHFVMPFGVDLWQVNLIKIHRNMQHPDAQSKKVRIHGAVRLFNAGRWADYVFKHGKDDPLVFEIPAGETLTLPLKGPSLPWVFRDDLGFPMMLALLLKYNDASIFGRLGSYPTSKLLEGSPDKDTIDHGGDFVGCADLFGEEGCNNLGYATTWPVSQTRSGREVKQWIFGHGVILPEVAYVEVEMELVVDGGLGVVKFISTATSRLMLHGKITARSCIHDSGIVLFEKNENEGVPVESNGLIPLSRDMTIAGSCSSLIIEARLWDVNDRNFVVNETMLFNLDFILGSISSKTMANGAIKVEVEWNIAPYYGGSVGGNNNR